MHICRNAEGVHGKKKFGNPCSKSIQHWWYNPMLVVLMPPTNPHASHSQSSLLAPPGATTLRIATSALVHSTAEYCAPVWCRSAHTHLIDLPSTTPCLHLAMTRCLHPTSGNNLPNLAGIQPSTELRRKGAFFAMIAVLWEVI